MTILLFIIFYYFCTIIDRFCESFDKYLEQMDLTLSDKLDKLIKQIEQMNKLSEHHLNVKLRKQG
jgi:hypothetical protein